MAKNKRAAFEELDDQHLSEITADQLLEATSQMDPRLLAVWPEKKKVELEVEPGLLGKVRLKDLVIRLQNEKKKYELELEPAVSGGGLISFTSEKKKAEIELDPPRGGGHIDPGRILGEKKKRELEVEPGGHGGISLDALVDRLEERFRDRRDG